MMKVNQCFRRRAVAYAFFPVLHLLRREGVFEFLDPVLSGPPHEDRDQKRSKGFKEQSKPLEEIVFLCLVDVHDAARSSIDCRKKPEILPQPRMLYRIAKSL